MGLREEKRNALEINQIVVSHGKIHQRNCLRKSKAVLLQGNDVEDIWLQKAHCLIPRGAHSLRKRRVRKGVISGPRPLSGEEAGHALWLGNPVSQHRSLRRSDRCVPNNDGTSRDNAMSSLAVNSPALHPQLLESGIPRSERPVHRSRLPVLLTPMSR